MYIEKTMVRAFLSLLEISLVWSSPVKNIAGTGASREDPWRARQYEH